MIPISLVSQLEKTPHFIELNRQVYFKLFCYLVNRQTSINGDEDDHQTMLHSDLQNSPISGTDCNDDDASDGGCSGSNNNRTLSQSNSFQCARTGSRSAVGADHTRCGVECDTCGGSGTSMSTLAMIILSYNNNDPKLAMNNVRQGQSKEVLYSPRFVHEKSGMRSAHEYKYQFFSQYYSSY